jgi:hypothetical protein
MPHDPRERCYTEDKLDDLVAELNSLFPASSRWEDTRAAKAHIDAFGAPIEAGEHYFKRQDGVAFDQVIKISRLSMDRFVHALRSGNDVFRDVAAQLHRAKKAERREHSVHTSAILRDHFKPKA